MKARFFMLTIALLAVFVIAVSAYAHDSGNGLGRGGMMGGHGGGMMGSGQWISKMIDILSQKSVEPNQNYSREAEVLRKQIGEKRR